MSTLSSGFPVSGVDRSTSRRDDSNPERATSPSPQKRDWRAKTGIGLLLGIWAITAALVLAVLAGNLDREVVGLLILALTVCLMMVGVHVSVSMALPSLLGLWSLGEQQSVVFALETIPRNAAASWTLSVIPMFVLMGIVLFQTGIATTIFDAAKQWIGWLPGGLGVATIFAGAGMSAASGSTLGVTYATSRICIPEMLRAGYSASMATGTVAMAGVLKMLLPPSITVVIYAGIAETPVGPQLMAGLVPGLVLAVLFAATIVVRTRFNPSIAPSVDTTGFTWTTRFVALGRAWPMFVLLVIVVGGLYSGVTTATESGALAALSAIAIGAWLGRGDGVQAFFSRLGTALAQTIGAVASIMLLLISVHLLTMFMALSGVVQEISRFIVELGLSRTAFLLVLVVAYVIMGMFMDELAMLLLTVPILIPILDQMNVDLIWFGVFVILLCEVGMVVPPVGLLSFVVHGIAQRPDVNLGTRITLLDVFRGVFWYVLVALALIVFLIFFPDLALWLPGQLAE